MNMQLDVCASGGNEALRRSSKGGPPNLRTQVEPRLKAFFMPIAVRDTKVCGPAWAASQETPDYSTPNMIRAAFVPATAQDGMTVVVSTFHRVNGIVKRMLGNMTDTKHVAGHGVDSPVHPWRFFCHEQD